MGHDHTKKVTMAINVKMSGIFKTLLYFQDSFSWAVHVLSRTVSSLTVLMPGTSIGEWKNDYLCIGSELIRERTSEYVVMVLGIKEYRIRRKTKGFLLCWCQGLGEAWALTWKSRTSLSSQETAKNWLYQVQESREGLIFSWLDKSSLFPNATGIYNLHGTCSRSQSSFSPAEDLN